MINFFKKLFHKKFVKTMEEEMVSFIKSLKGQDGGELGFLLVNAFDFRNKMTVVLEIDLMDPIIATHTNPSLRMILHKFIKRFQHDKNFHTAAAVMVWLHTLRAIEVPELRILGREIWGQLQRGIPYVDEQLASIEIIIGRRLDVSGYSSFPIGLGPM